MTLPKQQIVDPSITEKARGMIRANHSDGYISNYLGMVIQQVVAIRRNMPKPRGRPPTLAVLPTGTCELSTAATNAEQGSRALLQAYARYFETHVRGAEA